MKFNFNSYSKLRVLAIALFFLLFSNTLYASKKSNINSYETISICTLSQKILKDQVLTSMDVTYSNPQEEKNSAIKAINIELTKINKEKVNKKLHKKIVSLKKSWSSNQKRLESKIEKKSAKALYSKISSFGKSCLSVADEIAKEKKNSVKNQTAKLNFYVHQLTTLYIIKAWSAIDDKSYSSEVKSILASYQKLYEKLIATKGISDFTKAQLEDINKSFTTFKFMTTSSSGRYMPTLAAKKALKINALTSTILEGK